MIQIKMYKDGRRSEPFVLCDICMLPIADIDLAAVAFRNDPLPKHTEESRQPFVVHKGECHDQAERELAGSAGGRYCGWFELHSVLTRILNGTAFGGEEKDIKTA